MGSSPAQERAQQERAAREAARKAEQEAEQEAARQAKERAEAAEAQVRSDYPRQLRRGITLRARTCPDGEGKHDVVGSRPRINPEKVSCVDIHYEALCPGLVVGRKGVGQNFTGVATDCLMGDTYTIDPKPACPVKEVRVALRDMLACE